MYIEGEWLRVRVILLHSLSPTPSPPPPARAVPGHLRPAWAPRVSVLYHLESGKVEVREACVNTLVNGVVYDRVWSFTAVVYTPYTTRWMGGVGEGVGGVGEGVGVSAGGWGEWVTLWVRVGEWVSGWVGEWVSGWVIRVWVSEGGWVMRVWVRVILSSLELTFTHLYPPSPSPTQPPTATPTH
jgi:hypothetical protein